MNEPCHEGVFSQPRNDAENDTKNDGSLLREWKYGQTPPQIAVPFDTYTPSLPLVLVTVVAHLSRRLSDQWQACAHDPSLSAESAINNNNSNGFEPTSTLNEDSWELIEPFDYSVVGQLVNDSAPDIQRRAKLRRRLILAKKLLLRYVRRKKKNSSSSDDLVQNQSTHEPLSNECGNEEETIAFIPSAHVQIDFSEAHSYVIVNSLSDRSVQESVKAFDQSVRDKIARDKANAEAAAIAAEENRRIQNETSAQDEAGKDSVQQDASSSSCSNSPIEKDEQSLSSKANNLELGSDNAPTLKHRSAHLNIPKNDQLNEIKVKEDIQKINCQHDSKTFPDKPEKASRVVSFSSDKDNILRENEDQITVINDTLKIIFVGSVDNENRNIVSRLCNKTNKYVPSSADVSICQWNPQEERESRDQEEELPTYGINDNDRESDIDTSINIEGTDPLNRDQEVTVKFSVWNFVGKNAHHSTQELFFSPHALYIIVWDMTKVQELHQDCHEDDPFSLHDSDFIEDSPALHNDIDVNVQSWVERIQHNAPGSSIAIIGACNDNNDRSKRRYEIMRKRIENHEDQIVARIIQQLTNQNVFNDTKSNNISFLCHLKKLRPKFIFGSSLLASKRDNTGFSHLREKIVRIATGRDFGESKQGPFASLVGAKIPHVWLGIKEVVRELRADKHFFVEWNFLYERLKAVGIENKDDINHALHFMSSVGELAYIGKREDDMGDVDGMSKFVTKIKSSYCNHLQQNFESNNLVASKGNQITRFMPRYKYIFLNPKWLLVVTSSLLQPDLDNRLQEIHRSTRELPISSNQNFGKLAFPAITSSDAAQLWESNSIVRKALKLIEDSSNSATRLSANRFLEQLLVQYDIMLPLNSQEENTPNSYHMYKNQKMFLLPSLLNPVVEDSHFFRYKLTRPEATTLCYSWLFQNYVPLRLIERILVSSLRSVENSKQLTMREWLCWSNAFYFEIDEVKIFVRIADASSGSCIGSKSMSSNMKRLTISGQGNSNYLGRNIWGGGFGIVTQAIRDVIGKFSIAECKEDVHCPECLKHFPLCEACSWNSHFVQKSGKEFHICNNGHHVDTRILNGSCLKNDFCSEISPVDVDSGAFKVKNLKHLLGGVVLVCVYDSNLQSVTKAGTGFIVNKDQGFIVTAAHTVLNMTGDHIGKQIGHKILIGVIPSRSEECKSPQPAVFRYFARIVAKDPMIEKKSVMTVDACVLEIYSRLETDYECFIGIDKKPQNILRSRRAFKKENLIQLTTRVEDCELGERLQIVGFNQGGEGVVPQGTNLFRNIGINPCTVASHFLCDVEPAKNTFVSLKDIVVLCDSIPGESGGPCLNEQGEVVGILSRGESNRSYLAPTGMWNELVKEAEAKANKSKRQGIYANIS